MLKRVLKRSLPIWQFFTVGKSDRWASCNIYITSVLRGGQSVKSFMTTNLVGHLWKHLPELKTYEDEKSTSASEQLTKESRSKTLKQVTLEESSSRTKLWNSCDPRAVNITTNVGEMIALDYQSFSIVDSVGFVHVSRTAEPRYVLPSRRYITETMIPQI